MTSEEQARINIDNLLEQAGWAPQDAGAVNLYESTGVETHFTNRFDPEPRSRRVFSFRTPEQVSGQLSCSGPRPSRSSRED